MSDFNLNTLYNSNAIPEDRYMVVGIHELDFNQPDHIMFIAANAEEWVGGSGFFGTTESDRTVFFVHWKNSFEFRDALNKMYALDPWDVDPYKYIPGIALRHDERRLFFIERSVYESIYDR